jgi:hypothetical protein
MMAHGGPKQEGNMESNRSATIQPRLSANPLRHRLEGEGWLSWATDLYAHTLAELEMPPAVWEAHFKMRHPGPGYTETLQAQRIRLANEINRHQGE